MATINNVKVNYMPEEWIEEHTVSHFRCEGYAVVNCPVKTNGILPDGTGRGSIRQVVLPKVLYRSLRKLNPEIPNVDVVGGLYERGERHSGNRRFLLNVLE
jgi:hypothetical protein